MLNKYKIFDSGKEIYEYDGRKLEIPLRSFELSYVVKGLEYREYKEKPYSFSEYIGDSICLFLFLLFLSIPFYIFCITYSLGIFIPEMLIDLKKFNLDVHLSLFNYFLYGLMTISLTTPIMIYISYNKNKKRHDITRINNERILPFFKNKMKEVENVEKYKLENNISLDDCPKYKYYNIDEDKFTSLSAVSISSILSFLFIVSVIIPRGLELNEGNGTFDTIHYMNNKYTIFYKEYGHMKKKTFPENINVNIKINEEDAERTYSYSWLESKQGLVFSKERNENNIPYINININKDDYIKGSLLDR